MFSENKSVAIVFISIIILSLAAVYRNSIWLDEVTLWGDARDKSPYKARPYNNLGNALRDDYGLPEKAILEYRRAIMVAPNDVPPRHNLVVAYLMIERYDDAAEELLRAINIQPENPILHANMGFVYIKTGYYRKALREFEIALRLKPDYTMARDNIRWLKWQMGMGDYRPESSRRKKR